MSGSTDLQCLTHLGMVPREAASFDDVKKAYRKLAMKYHPDRAGPENEERFKLIKSSYEQLNVRFDEGRWDHKWEASDFSFQNAPWRAHEPNHPESRKSAYDWDREKDAFEKAFNQKKEATSSQKQNTSSNHQKSFGRFSFVYDIEKKTEEAAQNFFKSYLFAALKLNKTQDRILEGVEEMAKGFLYLYQAFDLTQKDLHAFKISFLKLAWAQESPGLFKILNLAHRRARASLRVSDQEQADILNPQIILQVYPSDNIQKTSFCVLTEVIKPSADGMPCNTEQKKFHEEIAKEFKHSINSVELFEANQKAYFKNLEYGTFAQQILKNRPELFEIYLKQGWINPNHPIYKTKETDLFNMVMKSSLPQVEKARVLWDSFGSEECLNQIQQDSTWSRGDLLKQFEPFIIEKCMEHLIEPKYQTQKMRIISESEELYRKIKKSFESGLMLKASSLFAKENKLLLNKAFIAVCKGDFPKFDLALSDLKSNNISIDEMNYSGVPLSQFVAWKALFEDGQAAFCNVALDALKNRFGTIVLKKEDPFGSTAVDSIARKNRGPATQAPRPTKKM